MRLVRLVAFSGAIGSGFDRLVGKTFVVLCCQCRVMTRDMLARLATLLASTCKVTAFIDFSRCGNCGFV
jgi:hypothetical protein